MRFITADHQVKADGLIADNSALRSQQATLGQTQVAPGERRDAAVSCTGIDENVFANLDMKRRHYRLPT